MIAVRSLGTGRVSPVHKYLYFVPSTFSPKGKAHVKREENLEALSCVVETITSPLIHLNNQGHKNSLEISDFIQMFHVKKV